MLSCGPPGGLLPGMVSMYPFLTMNGSHILSITEIISVRDDGHSSGVVLSTEGTLILGSTQPTRRCRPILVRSEWLLLTRSFHHTVQLSAPDRAGAMGSIAQHTALYKGDQIRHGGAKEDVFHFPEESSHQRMKAGSFCWPCYSLTCVNSA